MSGDDKNKMRLMGIYVDKALLNCHDPQFAHAHLSSTDPRARKYHPAIVHLVNSGRGKKTKLLITNANYLKPSREPCTFSETAEDNHSEGVSRPVNILKQGRQRKVARRNGYSSLGECVVPC